MTSPTGAFQSTSPDSAHVPQDSYVITPDDDNDLPKGVRAVRCDTGGILHCITGADQERYCNFMDGETRYFFVKKVFATGTTADGIEGMP